MKLFLLLSLLLTLNSFAQIATNQPIKAQDILDIKNKSDANETAINKIKTKIKAHITATTFTVLDGDNSQGEEPLVFDKETSDTLNELSTVVSTDEQSRNITRFTPSETGRYLVNILIWTGSGNNARACYIAARTFDSNNNSLPDKSAVGPVLSNAADRLSCSMTAIMDLTLGEYVEMKFYHTNTPSIDLQTSADIYNTLSITRID